MSNNNVYLYGQWQMLSHLVRTYTHFLINFRWLSSGTALVDDATKWWSSIKPTADDAANNKVMHN